MCRRTTSNTMPNVHSFNEVRNNSAPHSLQINLISTANLAPLVDGWMKKVCATSLCKQRRGYS